MEDKISGERSDVTRSKYDLRTFIPLLLTDSNKYWDQLATKCFALPVQLGFPTFFLTFTTNPAWADYKVLDRGSGIASES
jgi:hypothetical protein